MESVFYEFETQKNMDKVDIIRKHIGNDDFYDINGTPLLTKILSAMDEYAQLQVNNCSIPAVVGQSEQLKCEHKGRRTATELVEYCEDCKKILFHP